MEDHGISEALYLSDPEGNGIELYRDRPRSAWPWHHGKLEATPSTASMPLSAESLLAELDGVVQTWRGLPPSNPAKPPGASGLAEIAAVANTPVSKVPTMPPTPCTPNTSSESS